MKQHFIPLLLAAVVIFSSMSDCENNNIFYTTVESPANVTIDGIEYSSSSHVFLNNGMFGSEFILEDTHFEIRFFREFEREEGKRELYVQSEITGVRPIELNKAYYIGKNDKENSNYINISCYERQDHLPEDAPLKCIGQYKITDGWIKFTSIEPLDSKYFIISGEFEGLTEEQNTITGYFKDDYFSITPFTISE